MSYILARRQLLQFPSKRLFHTTAINMTKFDIEVVSDTVCPWCYVGKQKLDKAIKVFKERNPDANDEFNITWKPFYLNPDSPMQGMLMGVSTFFVTHSQLLSKTCYHANPDSQNPSTPYRKTINP